MYGQVIPMVVDVDRAEDVALAEALERADRDGRCRGAGAVSAHCWGIFRERTHSPGREDDDTEILRLTGKHLEARGYQVDLKDPEDVSGTIAIRRVRSS